MQTAQLRKPLHAAVWHRGPVYGPVTQAALSELLREAAANPQAGDVRCEVRCADGFSLRLCTSGDEGFESDEDATSAAGEQSREEIRVSDHVIRGKLSEEDSSSANSSCSDVDETSVPSPPDDSSVIHGADILFCHTEPAVPRGVLFVARQPQAGRDAALEATVLGCASDSVAKELYTSFFEVTRRLKWERYTNAKRKSDVMRASFRNVTDSLRLRPAGRPEESILSRMPMLMEREPHSLQTETVSSRLPADGVLRAESGPHSLPASSEISRILSLSTPEDGWEARAARLDAEEDGTWARRRERACLTPTRYVHNKGQAPAAPAQPAPRKHPTNPNLLLVPTKNGLEPYRVITGSAEPPRPPLVLYAAEFAPGSRADWAHKMTQFDTNNNRSRQAGRQQLYWMPGPDPAGWGGGGGGGRRAEQFRPRSRSKSPAGRHRAFELPGALSQAIRGLTSHLKRPAAETAITPVISAAGAAPAAPGAAPANPKSVMKKRDKASGSPETKRVTFSAYSTVQVMD